MDDIKWETPPPSHLRNRKKESPIADALRANPQQWARVFERPTQVAAGSVVTSIKKGTRAGFGPEGSFEATSRNVDGRGVVYARYVG